MFKCLHRNVQNCTCHVDKVEAKLIANNYDLICLSETRIGKA